MSKETGAEFMMKIIQSLMRRINTKKQTWSGKRIHEYARILSTHEYLFRGRFND